MSAFRHAVLSVAPERLEQFTMEMKKSISKESKKSDKKKRSSDDHKKKRRKSSDHKDAKRSNSSKVGSEKAGKDKKSNKLKRTSTTSSKDRSHRHSKRRRKSKPNKKEEDSDIDKNDLDLSIPMSPLTDLAKDRKVLLDAVFTIIKGPKLTSMLPDILKLMPIDEIKRLCQEQLDVMSSKRILHVLSGTEMHSSSGTDSSDEESKKRAPKDKTAKSSVQDGSLQTNFVDSTTGDSNNSTKSMLFPSAISTARASKPDPEIPVKEVANTDQDTVSTSTEPNFIYSVDDESSESEEESMDTSDPEEGEVRTSEDEDEEQEISESSNDEQHTEEVLVEEEEIDDTHTPEQLPQPQTSSTKRKRKVVVKTKGKKVPEKENPHSDEDFDNIVDEMLEEDLERVRKNPTSITQDNDKKNSTEDTNDIEKSTPKDGVKDNPPKGEKTPEESPNPYSGKSQLEILELELRARAIRSLMRAAQVKKGATKQ